MWLCELFHLACGASTIMSPGLCLLTSGSGPAFQGKGRTSYFHPSYWTSFWHLQNHAFAQQQLMLSCQTSDIRRVSLINARLVAMIHHPKPLGVSAFMNRMTGPSSWATELRCLSPRHQAWCLWVGNRQTGLASQPFHGVIHVGTTFDTWQGGAPIVSCPGSLKSVLWVLDWTLTS